MLHNLIDTYKNLQKTADINWKSIEDWYRRTDSEHVVYEPMQVNEWKIGSSTRPCQRGAFVMARQYFRFQFVNISDVASINEMCGGFSFTMGIFESYTTDNDGRRMPQQFTNAYTAFHDDLLEFKHMFDLLKDDTTSNEISLRALLENHIKCFYEQGFQYQALEKIMEQTFQEMQTSKKIDEDCAGISIAKILEIDSYFYLFLRNPEHFKNKALTDYFNQFSSLLLIEKFKKVLTEHQCTIKHANDIANLQLSNCKKISFFSHDEKEHRREFAPVLNEINNRVKKF